MPEKPKLTPEGLPILTSDISDVFARDISHMNNVSLVRKIAQDNPLVANFMYAGPFSQDLINREYQL